MIATRAIMGILSPVLPEVAFSIGPDLPDKPDRAAAVTRGPGGRAGEVEGAFDRGTFTVRMRGVPTDDSGPENDLEELRMAVERTPFPMEVAEHGVTIWPSGPSYPLPGPDSGRRYEYVQTYNIQVSTDI